jgi:hypothetical protein
MLNILIPLAGKNTFDVSNTSAFPKLLTDVNGKLLVERSSEAFTSLPNPKKIVVAAPKTQIIDYKLDKVLTLLDDSIELCPINEQTKGAVCSSLLAIEHLDMEQPLIISSFEQVLDIDLSKYIDEFLKSDVDAGVLTFEAIHPKWSYVKTDEKGFVFQAAEKSPISKEAIAGFYYFKNAQLFFDAAKNMIRNDVTYNDLFYISHTLNEIILNEGKVLAIPINKERYFHIHDEHSLEHFEEQLALGGYKINESLHTRTCDYIRAFNSKSIEKVAEFLSNDFVLNDPSVNIKGKEPALTYISALFSENIDLKFISRKIIVDSHSSVIEFELILGEQRLIGADIIKWNDDNQMISLNAYLHEDK